MEKINVGILAKHENTTCKYLSQESSGFDLHCIEYLKLLPNEPQTVETGLSLKFPAGFVGFIKGRPSVASYGIDVFNGVIDSDYDGKIKIILINKTKKPVLVQPFRRLAQLVFVKCYQATFSDLISADDGDVRTGGFGSTGL